MPLARVSGRTTSGDSLGRPKQAWQVQLAERDEAGEWRVVGEPLPDAQFDEMGLAHAWAENRNKRDYGRRFDWANEPDRGWIAVRVGQTEVVRVYEPPHVGSRSGLCEAC
jgi:hypothetical protein